jgi:hypothetical protein
MGGKDELVAAKEGLEDERVGSPSALMMIMRVHDTSWSGPFPIHSLSNWNHIFSKRYGHVVKNCLALWGHGTFQKMRLKASAIFCKKTGNDTPLSI